MLLDSSSIAVTVKTELVTQSGGPSILVLVGKSFTIDDVVVTGANALAIVAPGEIHVVGYVDARGHKNVNGPGSISSGNACVGGSTTHPQSGASTPGPGAGGGGHVGVGGAGGPSSTVVGGSGGAALASNAAALLGGCAGGGITFQVSPDTFVPGGGGGGAVQLVSLAAVTMDTAGAIDVAGGGGPGGGNGAGAGGTVVIEAPTLRISGPNSGIATNGGTGGGGCADGVDGAFSVVAAQPPACGATTGGAGGTSSVSAGPAHNCRTSGDCASDMYAGGGGGSVGALVVTTRDGTFALAANPVMSAMLTARALTTN